MCLDRFNIACAKKKVTFGKTRFNRRPICIFRYEASPGEDQENIVVPVYMREQK